MSTIQIITYNPRLFVPGFRFCISKENNQRIYFTIIPEDKNIEIPIYSNKRYLESSKGKFYWIDSFLKDDNEMKDKSNFQEQTYPYVVENMYIFVEILKNNMKMKLTIYKGVDGMSYIFYDNNLYIMYKCNPPLDPPFRQDYGLGGKKRNNSKRRKRNTKRRKRNTKRKKRNTKRRRNKL